MYNSFSKRKLSNDKRVDRLQNCPLLPNNNSLNNMLQSHNIAFKRPQTSSKLLQGSSFRKEKSAEQQGHQKEIKLQSVSKKELGNKDAFFPNQKGQNQLSAERVYQSEFNENGKSTSNTKLSKNALKGRSVNLSSTFNSGLNHRSFQNNNISAVGGIGSNNQYNNNNNNPFQGHNNSINHQQNSLISQTLNGSTYQYHKKSSMTSRQPDDTLKGLLSLDKKKTYQSTANLVSNSKNDFEFGIRSQSASECSQDHWGTGQSPKKSVQISTKKSNRNKVLTLQAAAPIPLDSKRQFAEDENILEEIDMEYSNSNKRQITTTNLITENISIKKKTVIDSDSDTSLREKQKIKLNHENNKQILEKYHIIDGKNNSDYYQIYDESRQNNEQSKTNNNIQDDKDAMINNPSPYLLSKRGNGIRVRPQIQTTSNSNGRPMIPVVKRNNLTPTIKQQHANTIQNIPMRPPSRHKSPNKEAGCAFPDPPDGQGIINSSFSGFKEELLIPFQQSNISLDHQNEQPNKGDVDFGKCLIPVGAAAYDDDFEDLLTLEYIEETAEIIADPKTIPTSVSPRAKKPLLTSQSAMSNNTITNPNQPERKANLFTSVSAKTSEDQPFKHRPQRFVKQSSQQDSQKQFKKPKIESEYKNKVNTATKPNKSLSKSSSKAKNFKNPSKSKLNPNLRSIMSSTENFKSKIEPRSHDSPLNRRQLQQVQNPGEVIKTSLFPFQPNMVCRDDELFNQNKDNYYLFDNMDSDQEEAEIQFFHNKEQAKVKGINPQIPFQTSLGKDFVGLFAN